MSEGAETKRRSPLKLILWVLLAVTMFSSAVAGVLGGLIYASRQDRELAAKLEAVPLLGQLFVQPPEPEDEYDELAAREAVIALKEQELQMRVAQLEEFATQLSDRERTLEEWARQLEGEAMQLEALRQLLEIKQLELDQLVEVYGQMKAAAVADILAELPDEASIAILRRLDVRHAAKVLEALEPEVAARYAQAMTL